ncbi:MAG: hypothetical protein A2539_02925 [Elusimicrobia bacterium RIFOXYD2_FULL_34_15]|nr:MAG: hypothetical protein A2539_02925 [Elusimicrobia bacterium RIFOXYD2_FULL_34_15]
MKSLTDYWRAKFVELQHLFNDDKKKSNLEKKELKDKIFEHTATIKELQAKIEELEKNISETNKKIEIKEEEKKSLIIQTVNEIESVRQESIENVSIVENKKNNEEIILISEFVRFLRKDIGNVEGLTRVLSEICKGKKAKIILNTIIEHTEWMSKLADELSWFSEPVKKEDGTINPDVLFDEVISEFEEILFERNIKISKSAVEGIPEVAISKDHLKIIFTEVIRNSFDAMPKGGLINIKINFSDKNILVEVSDTGRGIPVHLMPKVARPFFSTKKKNGFGFGLTRTRRILDVYNCQFDISSEEDIGTTVKISLPR